MPLTEAAPAKVNLYLHVTGRRDNGYHELDSLAVMAGVGDRLHYAPHDGLVLELAGPEAASLAAEPDNLVLRAARLLAEAAGIPARGRLVLEKHLPVASGIGGGSADAAAALRLLNRAWGLGWDASRLRPLAARLGADVPVCLDGAAARMGGIGEVLQPAPALPQAGMVLANPRRALSTPAVFKARSTGFTAPAALPAGWADACAMAQDLRACGNDLQAAAIALCPDIEDVLAAIRALPGCLLARMSGSGATCFGLFPGPAEAADVAARLPEGWWRWGGGFTEGACSPYSTGAGRGGA